MHGHLVGDHGLAICSFPAASGPASHPWDLFAYRPGNFLSWCMMSSPCCKWPISKLEGEFEKAASGHPTDLMDSS